MHHVQDAQDVAGKKEKEKRDLMFTTKAYITYIQIQPHMWHMQHARDS